MAERLIGGIHLILLVQSEAPRFFCIVELVVLAIAVVTAYAAVVVCIFIDNS